MNKFKESLKVSNETKQQIEEFLIKERRKIVADYKLTDKQKRDKIEKEELPLVIVGARKNKKTLEYGVKLGRIQALQELLEGRK